MIRYFFFINTARKSPNYMKPVSLNRMRIEGGSTHLERWNGKEWVVNNNLIAFTGIGGDNNYEETTESEAKHDTPQNAPCCFRA
jgi:hypothetical protein